MDSCSAHAEAAQSPRTFAHFHAARSRPSLSGRNDRVVPREQSDSIAPTQQRASRTSSSHRAKATAAQERNDDTFTSRSKRSEDYGCSSSRGPRGRWARGAGVCASKRRMLSERGLRGMSPEAGCRATCTAPPASDDRASRLTDQSLAAPVSRWGGAHVVRPRASDLGRGRASNVVSFIHLSQPHQPTPTADRPHEHEHIASLPPMSWSMKWAGWEDRSRRSPKNDADRASFRADLRRERTQMPAEAPSVDKVSLSARTCEL